jgi:hypothetical protein
LLIYFTYLLCVNINWVPGLAHVPQVDDSNMSIHIYYSLRWSDLTRRVSYHTLNEFPLRHMANLIYTENYTKKQFESYFQCIVNMICATTLEYWKQWYISTWQQQKTCNYIGLNSISKINSKWGSETYLSLRLRNIPNSKNNENPYYGMGSIFVFFDKSLILFKISKLFEWRHNMNL